MCVRRCGDCAGFVKWDAVQGVDIGICMQVDAVMYGAADDIAAGGDCACFAGDLLEYLCTADTDAAYCSDYQPKEG